MRVSKHALPRLDEAKGGTGEQANHVSLKNPTLTIEQLHKMCASTYHVAPIHLMSEPKMTCYHSGCILAIYFSSENFL